MDKLLEDMKSAEDRVGDLKSEVTKLESNVIERKRKRTSTFPSVSIDFCLCMFIFTYEPTRGKTNNLYMRKQRRRSASR